MRIEEGWNVKRRHITDLENDDRLEYQAEDGGGFWYYNVRGYKIVAARITKTGLLDIYYKNLEEIDGIDKILSEYE